MPYKAIKKPKSRLGRNPNKRVSIYRYLSVDPNNGKKKEPKVIKREEVEDTVDKINSYFSEPDISTHLNELFYITFNEKMFINKDGKYLWTKREDAIRSYKAVIKHSIMVFCDLTVPADREVIDQIFNENYSDFVVKSIKIR